jgi:hypothetical protein
MVPTGGTTPDAALNRLFGDITDSDRYSKNAPCVGFERRTRARGVVSVVIRRHDANYSAAPLMVRFYSTSLERGADSSKTRAH